MGQVTRRSSPGRLTRRASALLAGALLLVGACRHGRRDGEAAASPDASVTVEVVNYFAVPVDVDVVGSGTTHKLGIVNPGMKATFVIPKAILATSTVELEAHAAGQRYVGRSGPLILAPGDVVDFTVTSTLFNSTATIRQ